ncbi:MAG: GHMP kinase [Candidatus Eisenbacteria bacterium RBG_16_71_46]|nr:MAG: GHMP kinase [Candidatus Eisenbacteria bacterium RBG_16_71_46]OGF20976.1 MAG: GHMP kinase [Candidatus Eisenbacteria bacterium RBG_19FT_COMBO_70_11]
MTVPVYHRARAPLRLSFCGGGTDVSPYPEEHGGAVLSATINQYAYASLRPRRDSRLTIASLDYDVVARYDHPRRMKLDGNLDLIKAVVRALKVKRGVDLWVHSDAPPGSGLGSSSTLVVALIGVLSEWLKRPVSGYDAAELAYRIERIDMGLAGGRQDQYAAAFGGFNFIEFHRDSTVVTPLRIRSDILRELEYRLLLAYMGQTRESAGIIERQTAAYREGQPETVEALHRLKQEASEMKEALLLGKLDAMGHLLHQAWENKKRLDEGISNSKVDRLYQLARKEGAIGGKMPGAGGGGYFLLLTRFDRKHRVAAVLEKHGAQVVPFQFERHGLLSWSSPR